MIKIKYNNEEYFRDTEFSVISDNVVCLTDVPINITGFHTYKLSGKELGDFSEYTTLYKQEENKVMYSNDGSVYVEPEIPEEPDVPFGSDEPTIIVPTLEERVSDLETAIIELYETLEGGEE